MLSAPLLYLDSQKLNQISSFKMNVGKESMSSSDVVNEGFGLGTGNPSKTSKWARIKKIIWDGPHPTEEKKSKT